MDDEQELKPLDKEFGNALIRRVLVDNHLISDVSRSHWTPLIQGLHRSALEVCQYVARRFEKGEWAPSESWIADPGIQDLFEGYNRERYVMPNGQGASETPQNNQTRGQPLGAFGGLTPQTSSSYGLQRRRLQPIFNTPTESGADGTRIVPIRPTPLSPSRNTGTPTGRPSTRSNLKVPATLWPIVNRPEPTRLPSPPYDEDLDLDSEPEQTQTEAGTQGPTPSGETATADDGSIPPPLQPSFKDIDWSHVYKGQQMPSVSVQLNHIKHFLCDEDVDRDISWHERIAEAKKYLLHIRHDIEFYDIARETRDMVDRLLEIIEAHRVFEKYHYETFASTKVLTPDQVNKPAPRLNYDYNNPIVLQGTGKRDTGKNHEVMPTDFPNQPRVQEVVNDMWLTERESMAGLSDPLRRHYQEALAKAEDEWWQLDPDQDPPENNLAYIENKTYEEIIAADSGRGFDGWVDTQPGPKGYGGLTRMIAGPAQLDNSADSFARERGARRAGLQGALRQFRNMENQLSCTPWRRLVLPPSAHELKLARKNAGAQPGRKFELKALEDHKMRKTDGKDDPQGFTVAMAQFWRDQHDNVRKAREIIIGKSGARGAYAPLDAVPADGFVTPPQCFWGAYAWRAVDADTQNHQDMLKQMRAVKKLFDRELRIAPRQLLTYMNEMYKKGYANQGLTQGSVVFRDHQTKKDVVVDLQPRRDFVVANNELTDLDKMEMYWIRLLLNNSITAEMTQELEPRTTLYLTFAERLSRIFNDISDPLFGTQDTKVSVEDLLAYMHKKTDGPVKTAKFYAHDAQMWLQRLAAQGRCRYQEDWTCYGWVQRPVPDFHPEHLIDWQVPESDMNAFPIVTTEDMIFAPRFEDLRTWEDVIWNGQTPGYVDKKVGNYFYSLAYRWGRYTHKLENPENGLEKEWKTRTALPIKKMLNVIEACEAEFQHLSHWDKENDSWDRNPLVFLVKRTLPEKKNDTSVNPKASLQIIRDHIINEAVRNDSMLWPARHANNCRDIYDEKVRPPLWDWAKTEVRGPVKKFFDMNRWPMQMQTEEAQRRTKSDKDLSAQQLWNPVTEDTTPWKFYRPKARPYVDEKVKFRPGHRIYPIGDTPNQKKAVEDQMYATLGRAMGITDTDQPRPGLFTRLSSYFRRGNTGDDSYDRPAPKLPRVKLKDIPKSYDPRAEVDKKRKADDISHRGSRKARRLTTVDSLGNPQGDRVVDLTGDSDGEA